MVVHTFSPGTQDADNRGSLWFPVQSGIYSKTLSTKQTNKQTKKTLRSVCVCVCAHTYIVHTYLMTREMAQRLRALAILGGGPGSISITMWQPTATCSSAVHCWCTPRGPITWLKYRVDQDVPPLLLTQEPGNTGAGGNCSQKLSY